MLGESKINIGSLRRKVSLWKDFFATRYKWGRFPKVRGESLAGALVLNLSEWPMSMKYEGIVSSVISPKFNVSVLAKAKEYSFVKRYAQLFGAKKIFYMDEILHVQSVDGIREDFGKYLFPGASLSTFKSWKIDDFELGMQVLSSYLRDRHEGFAEISKSDLIPLGNLAAKSIRTYLALKKFFSRNTFDLIIVNEANGATCAAVIDAALEKKVPVLQFVCPSRDNGLYFWKITKEKRRMHPGTISYEHLKMFIEDFSPDTIEKEYEEEMSSRYDGTWALQARNQKSVQQISKNEFFNQLSLDKNKKAVTIFCGVIWDANLFYGEDLFVDNTEWFIEVMKAACENTAVNWLVKLHPANKWKQELENKDPHYLELDLIKKHLGMLPAHVRIVYPDTGISTVSFMKYSDYGICIRGTVGMEMPCFGKRCFTGGTGRYSGMGFTEDSECRIEFLNKLSKIETYSSLSKEEVFLAKAHALLYFKYRYWVFDELNIQIKAARYENDPMTYNLVPSPNFTFDKLMYSDQSKALREWILEAPAPDFVYWKN